MNSELYEAILEGRAPVKAKVTEDDNGVYTAQVKQWGVEVEAQGQSSRHAQNQAVGKFLTKIKQGAYKISKF